MDLDVDALREAQELANAEAQLVGEEARAVALEQTLESIQDETKQARFRVLQWAVNFYNTPANDVREIYLPGGLTSIKPDLCHGREFATIISVPEGVTYIGDRAFMTCLSVNEIILPTTVANIYSEAFRGCIALKRLSLPTSLGYIGLNAFLGIGVTCDISFNKNKTEIQAMSSFPWGLEAGTVIRCADGEIKVA